MISCSSHPLTGAVGLDVGVSVVGHGDLSANVGAAGIPPSSLDAFQSFSAHIKSIVAGREIPCVDYLKLQVALANLWMKLYPNNWEYIDDVMKNTAEFLAAVKDPQEFQQELCVNKITKLLSLPVATCRDIRQVLGLQHFNAVCSHLQFEQRKAIHVSVLRAVLRSSTCIIRTTQQVGTLLSFIPTLLMSDPNVDNESHNKELFYEEQNLVAATIHMFQNDDPEILLGMYLCARKLFGQWDSGRFSFTLPPLIFSVFNMLTTLKQTNEESFQKLHRRLFDFENQTIKELGTRGFVELALKLNLQGAQVAAVCKQEACVYEFCCQAFILYEEEVTNSSQQIKFVTLFVGTLHSIQFEPENKEILAAKMARYSLKLLKKRDQVSALCIVSHLFGGKNQTDGENRTVECLQKALRIADSLPPMMNTPLQVEILNWYMYFFKKHHDLVPDLIQRVNGLIGLISATITTLEPDIADCAEIQTTIKFFQNTLASIKLTTQSYSGDYTIHIP
ncbi:Vacuolar protein sorting-associated protein 35 [Pelomyxa schiedti]|nr:Vacuolar protein sorting-associated protein 35 [Pelomyxa schiedti]